MTATSPGPWVPPDTFAHRLVALRRELGMKVEEISRECDINAKTWSTWENGRLPHAMHEAVAKIAAGTGVSAEWLMWGTHNRRIVNLSLAPAVHGQLEFDYTDAPTLVSV